MKKWLILMPYESDSVPSHRYRWEQWEPGLIEQGIAVTRIHFSTAEMGQLRRQNRFAPLFLATLKRYIPYLMNVLRHAKGQDLVVVHRSAVLFGPPLTEWLLHLMGKKMLFDFDDAIYMNPPGDTAIIKRLFRCDWRIPILCRMCWGVGAGNSFLADYSKRYNDRVFIWPSTLDMNQYTEKTHTQTRPVIGWTGSKSTSVYLESILPEIAKLQQDLAFDFLVVGAQIDLGAYGVQGECIEWSPQQEVSLVQRMDIGLMPLNDSEWERGKCSFKALQYQAVGIPAVVSDVGMNREAVIDGQTGFLVRKAQDWKISISRLVEDTELRKKMGKAAREHIMAHYSAQVVVPRIVNEIEGQE